MPLAHTTINDDSGKLATIAALANDPAKSVSTSEEADIHVIEGANKKGSMQEAVQNALNDSSQDTPLEGSPTSETQDEEQKPITETKEIKPPVEDTEELDTQKISTESENENKIAAEVDKRLDQHPRFQELIAQRNADKPYVENAKFDEQFCHANAIPPEQKKNALELCALLNRDPEKALVQLEELVENIKLSTGKLLPPDLTKEIQDGTISKERATELHMNRLKLAAREQQAKQQEITVKQTQQNAITTAMNQAAEVIVRTNPDFKPKVIPHGKTSNDVRDGLYELTYGKIQLLSMEHYPTTPQEAVDILNHAFKWAQAVYVPSPTQRARNTLRTTDLTSSSDSTNGEPKSGETMAQYIQRTVGSRHGFALGKH